MLERRVLSRLLQCGLATQLQFRAEDSREQVSPMRKSLIYDLKQTQLLIHAPLRASLPDERETLVFDIKNTGREATQTGLVKTK